MGQINNIVLYVGVFGLVFSAYIFMQFGMTQREQLATEHSGLPFIFRKTHRLLSMFSGTLGRFLERILLSNSIRLKKNLIVSNLKISSAMILTSQFIFAVLFCVFAFFIIIFLFSDVVIAGFAAIAAGVVGWIYPGTVVDRIARNRQTAIIRALPFSIDLIAAAMRSGLDFSAAVRYYVANESSDSVLGQEFGTTLREMELGKTRVEALESMTQRIQMDEFTSFAASVIHGTEVGASISGTLKVQGEEMRRVRFNYAERKAARAPSIMILPIALFIMPAFFMVIAAPIFIRLQNTGGLEAILK